MLEELSIIILIGIVLYDLYSIFNKSIDIKLSVVTFIASLLFFGLVLALCLADLTLKTATLIKIAGFLVAIKGILFIIQIFLNFSNYF